MSILLKYQRIKILDVIQKMTIFKVIEYSRLSLHKLSGSKRLRLLYVCVETNNKMLWSNLNSILRIPDRNLKN